MPSAGLTSTLPVARRSPPAAAAPCASARGGHRTGFTFVELMISMTITAMIGAALAAFSLALATTWTDGETVQPARVLASQASLRIMPVMQDAKFTGLVRAGSTDASASSSQAAAAVIFWADDANGDGAMQLPEIAMVEHNAADHTIDLYEVQYPTTYTADQRAWVEALPVTTSDLNKSDAPETFEYVLRQIKSDYSPRALAAGIVGASFEMRDANGSSSTSAARPRFVYTLRLQDGDGSSVYEYGTATLRGAETPTN